MHILPLWFFPSFARYFKKISAALDSIRINYNSVWENVPFNAQYILSSSTISFAFNFVAHSRHGSWLMCIHILSFDDSYHLSPITLRNEEHTTFVILSSFGHRYFKKISAAFNSLRILRKFYFQCSEYFMKFDISLRIQFRWLSAAGHGSCDMHMLSLMILTIFLPVILRNFQQLWTALRINFNSAWQNVTFNLQNIFWR